MSLEDWGGAEGCAEVCHFCGFLGVMIELDRVERDLWVGGGGE